MVFRNRMGCVDNVYVHQSAQRVRVFYPASQALGVLGRHRHYEIGLIAGLKVSKLFVLSHKGLPDGFYARFCDGQGLGVPFFGPGQLHGQTKKGLAWIGSKQVLLMLNAVIAAFQQLLQCDGHYSTML